MWTDIIYKGKGLRVEQKIKGRNGRTYTVQEQIGTGGNAFVCECADEADGAIFAVKFLANSRDKARLPRFEQEARLLEALGVAKHDHLIRFVTTGSANGSYFDARRNKSVPVNFPFVIMERANCSLRDFITNAKDPVPPEIYIAQFRGLVSALEILHSHAIHRDIKPENILIVGDRWLISDFGLCSMIIKTDEQDLTEHWQIVGPRFWMSPEANNMSVGLPDEIGFASDIFQLAAVFWWVVNRRHPTGILVRADWGGIGELFEPISKALQHSMNRRFANANEFGTAVRSAFDS